MKELKDVAANKKKRTKQIIGYTIINSEGWEAIQEGERELQRNKKAKANEFTRKRKTTTKKKTTVEAKKAAKTAEKKNNKKDKKADHSTVINKAEEAIALLF